MSDGLPEMPLTSDPSGEFDASNNEALFFAMFAGDDRIDCRVDIAALRDRAAADGTSPSDVIETFKRHRSTIERIASEQYDTGATMPVVRTHQLTPG
ncbi:MULTISPECIES: DUF1488 family protein [unclassified Bradyrhizobium]|uniref:DUF1488 family protein n=1 Tax=unclassified Bradyrhizobium TaxID=2631580 RepID=UPI001FF9E1C8|nr:MULTISPECIES: DUF1488 family protein [unclassified Bradyrhizobium]MCK1345712.1 DUF1488 family protein [Bradyrhizobium sp. CW11]MCK1468768.1 DUF1488 family protein [Bradyrhizobium sp. CW10]MCK1483711.1 DUF1488 family protein [Bradyrhizobium sp. 193]MCK1568199.1 DUF1488 family protein [Bradyrhizobium sp. 173]MCK1540087.1 DUF1488 family protein [Bradyrhizobium sp. 176]